MAKDTKLCKHCKTEIPRGAKVCPQCRKRVKGGKLKWVIIIFAVICIIGVAFGEKEKPVKVNNGSGTTSGNDQQPQENATETEKEIFYKGETAEMNNVQVTLTGYTESTGSAINKPADGNEFVLIEFEIANNSDKELSVSSMMSFEAYADDYSLSYSVGALVEKGNQNQLDGSIAAGKKMKGVVGYEVPVDWKKIEVHFKDNVWSNNKFKFEISR